MHCALQGTRSDHQKVSEVREFYSSKKLLQLDDPKSSAGDFRISSLNLSYSDQRHVILTFLTHESDGSCKIVALPFQYIDHANHFRFQEQVKMDGFVSPLKADGWRNKKGPPPGFAYPSGPFVAQNFPGNNVQRQFQYRTVSNKVTNLNEFSSNSSGQSYGAFHNPPAFVPKRSKTSNLPDVLVDSSKEDKAVKRNFKTKARKKGKQNRKYWSDNGCPRPEICPEYVSGGFTPEAFLHGDKTSRVGLQSCATSSEVSSTDDLVNVLDSKGGNSGTMNTYESLDLFTSDVDYEAILGDTSPSLLSHSLKEHIATDSKIQMQMDQRLPVFDAGLVGEYTVKKDSHDDWRNRAFPEKHDSLVSDSASTGSNSDETSSPRSSVSPTENSGQDARLSEPFVSHAKEAFSSNLQNLSADANDAMEQTNYDVYAFRSNNVEIAVAGKRNKQLKTVPQCSSICKLGGTANLQGRSGKENIHSVWKKVQKNGVDEFNDVLKKMSPTYSHFDATSEKAPSFKKIHSVADVAMKSRFDDKRQFKDKALHKFKQKSSPISEQTKSFSSRKGSHISKVNLNAHTKTSLHRDGILDISTHLNSQMQMNRISMPFMFANECGNEMRTMKCERMNCEPVESSQVCPGNLESLESTSGTVSCISDLDTGNISGSQSKPVFLDQKDQPRRSIVYLPHLLVNYVSQMEKEVPPAEKCKQNQSSGSTLQKWIPVGVKDTGLMSTVPSGSSLDYSSEQDAKCCYLRNNIDERIALNSQNVVSSSNTGVMCMGRASENLNNSSQEGKNHFHKLTDSNRVSVNENHDKHIEGDLITGSKHQTICAHGSDFRELAMVLDNACKAQMASEAVQMETGHPIAEFERLLHFSCPVLCHSDSSLNCHSCSPNQVLCKHEIPNVNLRCLWEWYEKHGSYGLELRIEDCENPKRLGLDRYLFHAYFVPYLSAVQLFKNCKNNSVMNVSGTHTSMFSKSSVAGTTLGHSSGVGRLPMFSVLVPQPRTSDKTIVPSVSELHSAKTIVSQEDVMPDSSMDMIFSSDLELLFEYFETEQPQKRRPLYERVQELVTGDVPPRCNMYGDPAALNSMNLADLHPKSWYAVAWYPIYRIPDGNLRAAFLTFHSLGHLVRRSTKFDFSNVNASIVSPVVGLQSYNAQGECWFQLRCSTASPTAESKGLNPSGVLKERLRTLEETASLMARAVVNKGNQKLVNRHPDYEYFLSRRR